MSLAILGMGVAVPAHRYSQQEAAEAAGIMSCETEEQTRSLHAIYRQTRIGHRHMIFNRDLYADVINGSTNDIGRGPDTEERMGLYEREALPLALASTRLALERANVPVSALTHLVTVSCTGFAAPGFDIGLIKELGLPATIERTHVGFMGCHGALNGMRVASAFAGAQPNPRILLCATEICSIHYYYPWNPKRIVGNALFADGSAALVGVPASTAPADAWRAGAHGSCLFPDSEFAMGWTIGNHGFEMTLSAKVPQLIASHLRPWLESWLDRQRLAIGDVGSWAIHPGGPRVLSAVEDALGLVPGVAWASREILSENGNMSSPTVLFILERLRQADAPRPCVALGFGPGLVVEAALFQ